MHISLRTVYVVAKSGSLLSTFCDFLGIRRVEWTCVATTAADGQRIFIQNQQQSQRKTTTSNLLRWAWPLDVLPVVVYPKPTRQFRCMVALATLWVRCLSIFSNCQALQFHPPAGLMCVCREGCFAERTTRETAANEDDAFSFCQQLSDEAEAKNRPPWMETVKSLVPSAFSGKVTSNVLVPGPALLY